MGPGGVSVAGLGPVSSGRETSAPLPARLRILSLPSHTLEPAPFMLTGKGAILLPATDLSTPGVYISGLVTIDLQV